MKISHFPILILILLLFFCSCRELTDEKYISEGIIEYEIDYPETESDNVMIALMPKTMEFKFKKEKVLIDFNGGMGLFKATFVSNLKDQSMLHMVKILNKKYAIFYSSDELGSINNEMPDLEIEYLDDIKTIAGYECKRAIIKLKDDGQTSFDIYYTNDINLKSPNWSTPYSEIGGVLMEYQLKRYDITMKFTARTVMKATIAEENFIKPDDYKIITKEEMDQLFLNLN
jgi:GLPGLI family protein